MSVNPVFDSSITDMPQAATIEQSFDQAASAIAANLSSPATVNVEVSWGSVAGQSLPSGALGASVDELYGYYSLNQIRSWLPSRGGIPSSPAAGGGNYVLPAAEAKALGLVRGAGPSYDGYVGFGLAPSSYSFSSTNTPAGTYNFVGTAEHELDEVLGRISGIGQGYATPFDLFRYARNGSGASVSNFAASSGAYFSTDGGATQDGPLFNSVSGGDISDWASGPGSTDAQDAFTYPGVTTALSQADFDGLAVLGYDSAGAGAAAGSQVAEGAGFALVPEPSGAALLVPALIGLLWRRRVRLSGRALSG